MTDPLNQPDDRGDEAPEIPVDVETDPSQAEGYAPASNPDSPELTSTPGITEVAEDATAEEIEENGSLPDGPQRVNQQIV